MVKKLLGLVLTLIPVIAIAQPNEAWRGWDGPGPWHMWAGGWGFWWMFPFLMLVFFGVCIFFMMGRHGHSHRFDGRPTDSALRILAERFARGEINKDEYEEKKAALLH